MTPITSPHGRSALQFGLAAVAVYAAMIFGSLAPIEQIAGLPAFDMRPGGYSPEAAAALLAALGDAGRALYWQVQLPLDTAYPALMALTLSHLVRLAGRATAPGLVRAGCVLAWLAALLDYAENAGIAAMLRLWPDGPGLLVHMTSLATIAKSVATTAAILWLVALGAMAAWRRLRPLFRPI